MEGGGAFREQIKGIWKLFGLLPLVFAGAFAVSCSNGVPEYSPGFRAVTTFIKYFQTRRIASERREGM